MQRAAEHDLEPSSHRRHQEPRDTAAWPPSFGGDPRSEPRLPVDADHGLVCIAERRLDLEGGQHAGRWVAADDVDRSALAGDRERDFDINLPAVVPQELDCRVDGRGVAFVEQAINAFALPPRVEIEPGTDGLRNGNEVTPGNPVQVAPFDPPDDASRNAGAMRKIDLSPTATLSQGANDPSKPPTVHRRHDEHRPLSRR